MCYITRNLFFYPHFLHRHDLFQSVYILKAVRTTTPAWGSNVCSIRVPMFVIAGKYVTIRWGPVYVNIFRLFNKRFIQ